MRLCEREPRRLWQVAEQQPDCWEACFQHILSHAPSGKGHILSDSPSPLPRRSQQALLSQAGEPGRLCLPRLWEQLLERWRMLLR